MEEEIDLPQENRKRSRDSKNDELFIKKQKIEGDNEEENKVKKKIKKNKTYPFGNYPGYYGRRLGQGNIDPRIKIIPSFYISNKSILDIGCNTGVFTIQLSCQLKPTRTVGIDIDNGLANKAKKNIKYWTKKFRCPDIAEIFEFIGGNYLDETKIDNEEFDTVLCLSVTKWIHLNFGDEGIKNLFNKIKQNLKVKGYFILEIQDAKSYSKARKQHVKEETKYTLKDLELKPDMFVNYLTEQCGFELVETLKPTSVTKGFERPIHIFQKKKMDVEK